MIRSIAWFFILFNGVFPFTGSATNDSIPVSKRHTFSHPQMGTTFDLIFYLPPNIQDSIARKAADAAFRRVDDLNAIMSDYLPESDLNKLCAQAGSGKWVTVPSDLGKILILSNRFSKESHGAFDVSIGALSRLWRRARHLKQLPDSLRIQEALRVTAYQAVEIRVKRRLNKRTYCIRLLHPGMQLDLGGIAQGYAADACLEVLRTFGIRSALADAGGDIALGDAPPKEIGWSIELPSEMGENPVIYVKNAGITTSGARYKFLDANGKRYSHIIDPRSGWGLTHRNLLTVQAPNATTADAWATALSVMGGAEWDKIKEKYPYLRVWITGMGL